MEQSRRPDQRVWPARLPLEFLSFWNSKLLKTALMHAQFYSFKIPQKRINTLEAFTSVNSRFNKTQCLEFLVQFFRKLEWPVLYTHYLDQHWLKRVCSIDQKSCSSKLASSPGPTQKSPIFGVGLGDEASSKLPHTWNMQMASTLLVLIVMYCVVHLVY